MRNTNRYSHTVATIAAMAVAATATITTFVIIVVVAHCCCCCFCFGLFANGHYVYGLLTLCDHVVVDPLFREIYGETVHYENGKHI